MAPERKLYQDLRKHTPQISWTRLENLSGLGTPDLLGYNTSGHFFTLELKVTRGKKIKFSPHQISFHVQHPNNSFILIRSLGQRSLKLFQGSRILELDACGYDLSSELAASWPTVLEALLAA
jgi:Holliday junction resolvase